jgi:hypothetical protein
MGKIKSRDGFFIAVPVMKNGSDIPRNPKIRNRALIDIFLSKTGIGNHVINHYI